MDTAKIQNLLIEIQSLTLEEMKELNRLAALSQPEEYIHNKEELYANMSNPEAYILDSSDEKW